MAAVTRSGGPLPRLTLIAAAIAALGVAGLALGLVLAPARTWAAYLTAFTAVTSTVVGGLVLHLVGYATNAGWMAAIRRLTEALCLPLPALAVLFVPLLFGADQLYPWAGPPADATAHELHLLAHRRPYLDLTGFAVRGAVYFAIWLIAAGVLRRWSLARERRPPGPDAADPEAALGRERAFSCAMLPPIGLALTFAAFDWLMSRELDWHSSIFGVYLFAGGFLAAIAALVVLAWAAGRAAALADDLTVHHFHALGRLLLAFVVFWAYCAYFQVLLILIADRPEEVSFYLLRGEGGWGGLAWLLGLGHFAAPFLLLLPRRIKLVPPALAAIAIWLLVMHAVDILWVAVPPGPDDPAPVHPVDLAAFAAVGGLAVACAAWRQRGVSLRAVRDPLHAEGVGYRSPL